MGFDVLDRENTIKTLSWYRSQLGMMGNAVSIIKSVADIERAKTQGKLAISFDIEGVNALNGDVGMVAVYHDLGVRQLLFAYNLNNAAAGGCHDQDCGLTSFGKSVVREMNRVGMIVDCSHVGRKIQPGYYC